jgi:sulfide:quinone oxidoreductase
MAAGRFRVVIAGGGVAALEAMVALRELAGEFVDVTLLAPEAEFLLPPPRGLVITGGAPAFLRAELRGGWGPVSEAAREPLWWPPGKIAGRYLAPFLAEQAGLAFPARAAV